AARRRDRLGNLTLGLVAAAGLAHRCTQPWHRFLGLELRLLPVPVWLAAALGVLAAASVLLWTAAQLRALLQRRLEAAHAAYVASHVAIFGLGYLLVPSLDVGWLIVNVWHN